MTGTNSIFDMTPEEKQNTTLGDLPPNQKILIVRERTQIHTSPRELMRGGRMPHFLTLDQVEFAFSTDDEPKERGAVVPIWRHRLPTGRF